MRYAENTSVSTESSKAEIEKNLMRYGATGFLSGWDQTRAYIAFEMNERRIRFVLPLPDRNSDEFKLTPSKGHPRSDADAYKFWEQSCRQRWRALALAIKAKLEAVECGITTFEDEFLSHIVLPNGDTAGSWIKPQIDRCYRENEMPKLLPSG